MQFVYELSVTGDYILTELGESCEDRGLVPIATESKCESLISILQNDYPTISYIKKINMYQRPKGCYAFFKWPEYGIDFNDHLFGSSDSRTRSICNDLKGKASK